MKLKSKYKTFHSWKCIWKCCLRDGSHFVQGGDELNQSPEHTHPLCIPSSWYPSYESFWHQIEGWKLECTTHIVLKNGWCQCQCYEIWIYLLQSSATFQVTGYCSRAFYTDLMWASRSYCWHHWTWYHWTKEIILNNQIFTTRLESQFSHFKSRKLI